MIEIDPFVEVDSLDRVELIMALEETFHARNPDNETKKIKAIRHALELMDKLKAKQEAKSRKN